MRSVLALAGVLVVACAGQTHHRETTRVEPALSATVAPAPVAPEQGPAASAEPSLAEAPPDTEKTVELSPAGPGVLGLIARNPMIDERGRPAARAFQYSFTTSVGEGVGKPAAALVVAALRQEPTRDSEEGYLVVRRAHDGGLVMRVPLELVEPGSVTPTGKTLDQTLAGRQAFVDDVNRKLAAWRFRAMAPCECGGLEGPDDDMFKACTCVGMGRVEIHHAMMTSHIGPTQAARATLQTPRRRYSWGLQRFRMAQAGSCPARAAALFVSEVLVDTRTHLLALALDNEVSGCCDSCRGGGDIRGLLAAP